MGSLGLAPEGLPACGTWVPGLPWTPGVFRWNSHPSDARLVARGGSAGTCRSCGCQLPVLVGLSARPPVGMEPEVRKGSIGEVGVLALSPAVATHPPESRRKRSGRVCVGSGVTCFHLGAILPGHVHIKSSFSRSDNGQE